MKKMHARLFMVLMSVAVTIYTSTAASAAAKVTNVTLAPTNALPPPVMDFYPIIVCTLMPVWNALV